LIQHDTRAESVQDATLPSPWITKIEFVVN
jgi:hypothetical protein